MSSKKSKPAPAAAATSQQPAPPVSTAEPPATPPSKAGKSPRPTAKSRKPKARGPKTARSGLSGLDAAHKVLTESREPLNVRAIAEKAMAKGWWNPSGKTPTATLAAAIGREIKLKGKHARFKKTDRGLFASTAPKRK